MSDCINHVTVSGNLGADPELRFSQGGTAVLSMRLCSTTSYLDKDKKRQERQAWLTCKVFGKRAEGLAKFLKKGHYLVVEGAIETGSYDDRDGNKRTTFDIVANNIIVPPRGDGQRRQNAEPAAPQRDRAPAPDTSPPDDIGGGFGGDDDTPFVYIGSAMEDEWQLPRKWL
jgi:single-strand DNA-binding protein